MKKHLLMLSVLALLISSTLVPMTLGSNTNNSIATPNIEDYNRYLYPEHYDSYSVDEIPENIRPYISNNDEGIQDISNSEIINHKETPKPFDGPMDSAWPMKCHDARHTGRSPYSTVDTWDEIWRFDTYGTAWGGPAVDNDGIIYIGAYDLHAVYPNGTEKWTFDEVGYYTANTPAIDENGTIYIGTRTEYYGYAINPNGTRKWRHHISGTYSSPAIAKDGTIIITDTDNWYIKALYPNNGTTKWNYKTNHVIYSSPAIGEDGVIYCGCHDHYLHALYPNNGTLKWKYGTGHWIRTSPCIGDDGTIYVVSLDSYLHALYPNGTLKWKTDVGAGTSPTIGQDGTIYAGYTKLHAINPINGTVKWKFNVGGTMRGASPCNSIDGTIYVGTSDGGELIAINSDGTEKWRKSIGTCESAPAIGRDGVVYIGSYSRDCLYAFGIGELEADANGPYYGLINQPVQLKGSARGGYSPYVSWHWTFGDGDTSDEQNPIHTYTSAGNYTVTLTVIDTSSNSSSDTTWTQVQATNDPPEKPIIDGRKKGEPHQHYDYTFVSTEPEENPIWYYVDWGDNISTGWLGPYDSGHKITLTHTWHEEKIFIIKAKAKDIFDAESEWATFEVNLPRNKVTVNSLFLRFLERFPLLERFLSLPGMI